MLARILSRKLRFYLSLRQPSISNWAFYPPFRLFTSSNGEENDNNENEKKSNNLKYVSNSDGKPKWRNPSPKYALGEEMVKAVKSVASDLHGNDKEKSHCSESELLSQLMSYEKQSYKTATEAARSELAADEGMASLLSNMVIETRKHKSGKKQSMQDKVHQTRQQAFYRATQRGIPPSEACRLASEAAEKVQKTPLVSGDFEPNDVNEALETMHSTVPKTVRRQRDGFDQLTDEQMDSIRDTMGSMRDIMFPGKKPDKSSDSRQSSVNFRPSLEPSSTFSDDIFSWKPLGLFKNADFDTSTKLPIWSKLQSDALSKLNEGMGPRNAFEEMIKWTDEGKMWPYPIDNEWKLGEEANVGFHEHVFLERHLTRLNFPQSGPIRHFMELVCNGLSKNAFMTVDKKIDHIEWFAKYFDQQRVADVARLHEKDRLINANK